MIENPKMSKQEKRLREDLELYKKMSKYEQTVARATAAGEAKHQAGFRTTAAALTVGLFAATISLRLSNTPGFRSLGFCVGVIVLVALAAAFSAGNTEGKHEARLEGYRGMDAMDEAEEGPDTQTTASESSEQAASADSPDIGVGVGSSATEGEVKAIAPGK